MNRPFLPRPVARDALAYRNLLSHHREPIRFSWRGTQWQFRLAPCDGDRPGRLAIAADWGGARVVVRSDRGWLDAVAQTVTGVSVGAEAPLLLLQAVLETACAEASALLERTTRKRVRIDGVVDALCDVDGLEGFGWRIDDGAVGHCGEIWVDALGLSFLAGAIRPAATCSGGELDLDALPVPVRPSVGWVDLEASALADLELRDVLMLDECWLHSSDELMLSVGGGLGFSVRITGTALEVTDGWRRLMDEELEASPNDEEVNLDELPVRLTFDLGERSIPLGELRTLMPGYTFELGRDVRHAVFIRANGRAIGEGELVDVDGRIGVSILRLSNAAR